MIQDKTSVTATQAVNLNQATARDLAECPLCRAANGCSLLQGKAIEDCWCRGETFPAPKSVSIAPIGIDACICRDCLKKLQQEASLNCIRLD